MVQIYSRKGCAPCDTLKYWLNSKNIDFEEIEHDSSVTIFPTVIIGDQRIVGLNFRRLNELLLK